MESEFWLAAWQEGRTGFHQNSFNEKLLKFFPFLKTRKDQKVLVPLCGKSLDMLWLKQNDLLVHGYELAEQAVVSFFEENKLTPYKVEKDLHFTHFSHSNITVSSGDFFEINREQKFDVIYDRASLVALPSDMRKKYAQLITDIIVSGGKYLLIVYEYNLQEMEGPPFSVSQAEVSELFQSGFSIQQLEVSKVSESGPKFSQLSSLKQVVYLLERKQN